jgi:outer membrane receptor protein involved in Fe transport
MIGILIFKSTRFYSSLGLLLCSLMSAHAQERKNNVFGAIVNEKNTAIPFAEVILKNSLDSNMLKTILADSLGHFGFTIPSGKYLIEVKSMGYTRAYTKTFELTAVSTINLGSITLQIEPKQLGTVTVDAKLPFIERRADKVIVNLNGLGSGAPIMEVMNQLPGVTVDASDRISLNGKSVQIYIDGKVSPLSADALSGLLKGISAAAIEKVELISQPSAKYDAAGNGAIINIIRKRSYKGGLDGNIYAGAGEGTYGKANGGVNLNYKGKGYNLLLNLDYNYNKYFYNTDIATNFLDDAGTVVGQSVSNMKSTRAISNYTPNLGMDFYLSNRTTLSASVKPGFQTSWRDGIAQIEEVDVVVNSKNLSEFSNDVAVYAANFSSGLRLQHQLDTAGRDLTMDLDYYRYANYNDQNNRTVSFDPFVERPSVIAQDRILDVYAFKTDYVHPFGKGRQLEMGMKTSFVYSDNSNDYQEGANHQTDLFDYRENISALYLTYGVTGEKFSYQLGIRGEYTHGQGEEQSGKNIFKQNYFNPFPSVHLDYKFTKNHNLSLGINKRIERPGYESLNPLIRIINSNNLQQGNPALRPVLAYNADLWYGYKNAFFAGVTYSYSVDDFTNITVPLEDGVVTTSPGNADHASYFTLQAMYGKQVLPWWYTSSNAILSKRSFRGEFNGNLLQTDGRYSISATSYNSFLLHKNFSLLFLFNYRGKSVERNITNEAFAYLTVGVRQQFLKKRASVQLNVVDVFNSYKNKFQQNSGPIQQNWRNHIETQMVKLNLTYSFGGSIRNAKKVNGAEDEKNRSVVREN